MRELLRKLNLSEGEITIYEALLDLGSVPLNRLHEHVRIERRNIYDILNKLIERGFVTYITENKRRHFRTTHPKRILGYLEEQQEEIEQTKKEIEKELQALVKKFHTKREGMDAEIYRGADGIKSVWEDMLNHRAIHWIGSGRYVPKAFPHFFARWNMRRVQKKIKMYNLMRKELRREVPKPHALEYVRYLPEAFSGNPTVICIYGNKMVNFSFGKELFAFVIESKELAENYRAYHTYLWENVGKD